MSKIDYSKYKKEQIEAARMFAMRETGEKITIEEIAKKVGVTERTIYRWKEDPEFIELCNHLSDMVMDQFLSELYGHLRKQVRSGSVRAMELALKRMGKLIDRREVSSDVNVKVKGIEDKSIEELEAEAKAMEAELLGEHE